MSGLLGKKIGMTRIFDDTGSVVPVTVIKAGPCYVTQIRSKETDGYNAVQLGFEPKKEKNIPRPLQGHFKKANVPTLRYLSEVPVLNAEEVKIGDQLKVDMFNPGDKVKIAGRSKGRGFTGVIKRHGFSGGQRTHGQSDRFRAPGSIGQSSFPSKVFKGQKMAGRSGNQRNTVRGLQVIRVDTDNHLLFVKGAIPGARNSFVEIYKQ